MGSPLTTSSSDMFKGGGGEGEGRVDVCVERSFLTGASKPLIRKGKNRIKAAECKKIPRVF